MEKNKFFENGVAIFKNITSIGTSALIGNIATVLMPEVILPVKVCAYIGSFVLSCMVSDKTEEYIDSKAITIREELEKINTESEKG